MGAAEEEEEEEEEEVVVVVVLVVLSVVSVVVEGLRVKRRLPCLVPTGRGRDLRRRSLPCRAGSEFVVY